MSKYEVDFAGVQSQEVITPGKYEVIVDKVEMRQSEGGTHPYLNWECSIVAGDHEGRKLYMVTSLSPKALWKLKETMVSFGFDSEGKLEMQFDEDTGQLLDPSFDGQAAIATVFNEPYQGRKVSKISDLVAAQPVAEPVGAIATKDGEAQKSDNPFRKTQGRNFK